MRGNLQKPALMKAGVGMRSMAEADLNLSVRDRDDPLCASGADRGATLNGIDSIAQSKTAIQVVAVARPGQSESRDNRWRQPVALTGPRFAEMGQRKRLEAGHQRLLRYCARCATGPLRELGHWRLDYE